MRRSVLASVLSMFAFATVSAPFAQEGAGERIDTAINAKIRAEEDRNSQVMVLTHYLTDVYGPRVTGTPHLEDAGKWAVKTMEGWGLKNGALEPWDWGHEGWLNEEAWGAIVSPVKDNLVFEVEGWTPSTKGVVTAPAVHLIPKGAPAPGGGFFAPTAAELDTYLSTLASKVKGAIVLVGAARVPPFQEADPAKRLSDEDLARRLGGGDAPRRGGARRGGAPAITDRLSAAQIYLRVHAFLLKQGAAVLVKDAYRRAGQIATYNAGTAEGVPVNDRYDSSKTLPIVLLRNEDYGRIARLLDDGVEVKLKFNIVNRTFPQGRTSYNAVAEIPGSDKAGEVVMLGGHLDSWHSATGATDNAIGCAVMMEAVRILQTIDAKPRRTIRVALWSGEEQGLLGSLAYVAQHFGSAEQPKRDFSALDAYWNIDNGTGRVRGALVFGPPAAAEVITQLLDPFKDLGFHGAIATTSRATGGTDSTSFNHAGLPGINAIQDPMEYESQTHHTNLDTYERIVPDDVKKNAMMTASLVYHLATRDDMLPRN
jgi:hypothetical protein